MFLTPIDTPPQFLYKLQISLLWLKLRFIITNNYNSQNIPYFSKTRSALNLSGFNEVRGKRRALRRRE